MSKHDATLHPAKAPPAPAAHQPFDGDDLLNFAPARPLARHDGWTGTKQRVFIETLADTGVVERAARAVGMSVQSAYALRRRSDGQAFVLAWEAALHLARQKLIDTAWSRALEGVQEEILQKGYIAGSRTRYNDRLLMFLISRGDRDSRMDRETLTYMTAEFDRYLEMMEVDADTVPEPLPPEEEEGEDEAFDTDEEEVEYTTSAVAGFLENRCIARQQVWLLNRLYRTKEPPESPLGAQGSAPGTDISDLDPDYRDQWTTEQWERAWLSGLTQRMVEEDGKKGRGEMPSVS